MKTKNFFNNSKPLKFKLSNGYTVYLHYLTVVGSTLHGLNTSSNGDFDLKGVFSYETDLLLGLNDLPEQFDKNSMEGEDRLELLKLVFNHPTLNLKNQLETLKQTEQLHNVDLSFFNDEQSFLEKQDLDLFEAKKFFLNTFKHDSNMFDMLFARNVSNGKFVLFSSKQFDELLLSENQKLFFDLVLLDNFNSAYKRFRGMGFNTFKLGKKNKSSKDLAKSLQSLYLLKNMFTSKTFYPRLKTEQNNTVLKVKSFQVDETLLYNELVEFVDNERVKLENELLVLFNDFQSNHNNSDLNYNTVFNLLNKLLLKLRK